MANGDIQFTDTVVGNGDAATSRSVVLLKYAGTFDDGTPINGATVTDAVEVSLVENTTIPGFRNGILGILQPPTPPGSPMKVGGKRRITIPAAQAYGVAKPNDPFDDPQARWPPNVPLGTLIFDVELVGVLRLNIKDVNSVSS